MNPPHHLCFKAEKVKDFQRLDEVSNGFNDLILKKAYRLPASNECLNPCRCSDLGKKIMLLLSFPSSPLALGERDAGSYLRGNRNEEEGRNISLFVYKQAIPLAPGYDSWCRENINGFNILLFVQRSICWLV